MKQKHAYFALAAALVVLVAGYASPQLGQDLSNTPKKEKNSGEALAEQCILNPAVNLSKIRLGSYEVYGSSLSGITFSASAGNITGANKVFDYDTLYEISTQGGPVRFRIGDDFFVEGRSHLGNIAWESGNPLKGGGVFEFYALKTEQVASGKTLTMIGDSITWWSYGRYMRCLLSNYLPEINFTGPHTDPFGFGHAGEGGDNTINMLARLDKIRKADYYFILAGTNDWPLDSASTTIRNIQSMAHKLSEQGSMVVVSTTLPRLDEHERRNKELNSLLLQWNGNGCNCKVIDLNASIKALPNLKQYYWDEGLHPNVLGYEKFTYILGNMLWPILNKDR